MVGQLDGWLVSWMVGWVGGWLVGEVGVGGWLGEWVIVAGAINCCILLVVTYGGLSGGMKADIMQKTPYGWATRGLFQI